MAAFKRILKFQELGRLLDEEISKKKTALMKEKGINVI